VSALQQLGLDQTLFIQFAIFAVLYLVLNYAFFRPFLKLFQIRHRRTVEDREAAEKMVKQADAKFAEYKQRLAEERQAAKRELDATIEQAKKEEAAILGVAREEARKITQEASESIGKQRDQLRKQLELDVELLARNISEKLISRKV
jgi:F-type H+-transporting ATPase subunit b